MKFITAFFPAILLLIAYAIIATVLWGIKIRLRHNKRRSPFPDKFLRSPGESLKKQIDNVGYDISSYLIILVATPLLVYSVHISESYFGGAKENLLRISASFITGSIILSIFTVLLVKALKKRRNLRLGYDGELAVGQQLNEIIRYGYHIFHDFPCNNFNIDHIAVGPSGVFSIETKARRKPILGNGRVEAEIVYDGNSLKFPNWTEKNPIKQAINQATWLSNYLSKAVGENIDVQPVTALPGWYVKRTSPHGIPVVNPKNFSVLLKKNILTGSMIKRIAHQLEQKCRDVEPNVNMEKKT